MKITGEEIRKHKTWNVLLTTKREFFSRALFALAAKWGVKKCCRLVDISYNDTFKRLPWWLTWKSVLLTMWET